MHRIATPLLAFLALGLLSAGCTKKADDTAEPDSGNVDTGAEPCGPTSLVVGEVPEEHSEMGEIFSQYVSVFGIPIFATSETSEEDILHAAKVLAEYLDNDEDGSADDQAVLSAMVTERAALVMASTDFEMEQLFNSGALFGVENDYAFQDLYGSETHPEGSGSAGFDATLEEVLHLVTFAGYAQVYPDTFGFQAGTSLADAMDVARGGHYQSIPNSYPDEAWYHYDDWTCDYECMAVEYFYWGLTSLLGAQDYGNRCQQIAHEWEPCTSELMASTDVLLTGLLQDPAYKMPTVIPDGDYAPLND